MAPAATRLQSVCVFCGSADAADPAYLRAANELGRALAEANLKLVYGGGGVGLMGACAKAAHGAGGQVLGLVVLQGQALEVPAGPDRRRPTPGRSRPGSSIGTTAPDRETARRSWCWSRA